MQNVLDFGAKGDGKTLDTAAIQAAIDAGGEVYFPKGTYISGTLYLKSGGGLNLAAGAVLRASHDRANYNADDFCEQNSICGQEIGTGAHLIVAVEKENIFLKGEGIIDADSHYWMNETKPIFDGCIAFAPHPDRIAQMIFLCECKNVKITDISLRYAPYWHLFLHGCEDVQIRGVSIKGEPRQYTNDGIDIDCCKRVTVSDCIIDVGDDALTLRADEGQLKEKRACEDVTVTNCVLSAYLDYGIRIGVGAGKIRNCLFSNIRIHNSNSGIGFTAYFALYRSGMAATIENIRFSNMLIDADRPLEIRVASQEDAPPALNYAYIKNIVFQSIRTFGKRNNNILGFPNSELSHITFTDCDFVCNGKGKITKPIDERGIGDNQTADSLFVIRKAKDVRFRNCDFSFTPESEDYDYDASTENCENIQFYNCLHSKGVKDN